MNRSIMKRVLIVLVIFAVVVLIGSIDSVRVAVFYGGMLLGLIPTVAVLIFSVLTAVLVLILFKDHKLIRWMLLALLICQGIILFAWIQGWTAASAFRNHSPSAVLPVIDPQLEEWSMILFWLFAALVIAVSIEHLIHPFLSSTSEVRTLNKAHVSVLLFEILLLVTFNSNFVNFMRNGRDVRVSHSTSPDGNREIRLVPLNAFIDTNGIMITRKPGSPLWRTVGEIGDLLTETDGGRFVWSNDGSQVYLLVNFHDEKDLSVFGFDFRANKHLDPGTYVKSK